MKDKYNKDIYDALERVAEAVPNSIIRESAGGVPHVVVKSFYSVSYFFNTKTYTIFSHYATPQNKTERRGVSLDYVINYFTKVAARD